MSEQEREFLLQFSADGDELVGARWWNEAAKAERHFPRRELAKMALVGGLVVAGAVVIRGIEIGISDDDDIEIAEALELQHREGWDVGKGTGRLTFSEATTLDVDGKSTWSAELQGLTRTLEPAPLRFRPYYVSTLFDALSSPTLRAEMRPVHAAAGDSTFERAGALAELLASGDSAKLGVILDLPGEQTVAAAAALAPHFWPVFGFGNWPHPRGVVDSHQTLGAVLYYLPRFREAASRLSAERPPMFVLDSARLTSYGDNPDLFDNRYMAKLPSADNLRSLGVERLLYVRPAGAEAVELDDLNDDFVELERAGVDVRLLSLGDFTREAGSPSGRHYWGGSPLSHVYFWPSYGYRSSAWRSGELPANARFQPRKSLEYTPARRDTQFSARTVGGMTGVGKQKPSGFGLVSRRGDRTVGVPRSSGRSGSFGRSSGSYFSG